MPQTQTPPARPFYDGPIIKAGTPEVITGPYWEGNLILVYKEEITPERMNAIAAELEDPGYPGIYEALIARGLATVWEPLHQSFRDDYEDGSPLGQKYRPKKIKGRKKIREAFELA
jgi:hypothetical protein